MRKIFGILAALSFFALFGFVGGVEQDMISLGRGFMGMVVSLAAAWFFTWLAGGFDYSYAYDEDEERESRPRYADRKAASVNAHSDYIRYFND